MGYEGTLDTTYLMPLAGLETDRFGKREAEQLFSLKEEATFIISHISMIEIKWLIINKTRKNSSQKNVQGIVQSIPKLFIV